MFRRQLLAGIAVLFLPAVGWSAPPRVAVDIAPLHSIVSQVMDGVAEPDLLIQPEASPHSYSLRPSEAEALSRADVVFWISSDLTPWLESALKTLAESADKVELLALDTTITRHFREGATFEAHDHGQDESGGDHHDSGHHSGDHGSDEGHHHGEHDPHAWLDPINAAVWAGEIARVLAAEDPANARLYRDNARDLGASLAELTASLDRRAQDLEGIRFIVFHDAYQYFERRFGLAAAGAISLSDATDPGPARIREIQTLVSNLGVTCAFTEPQYNPGLIDTVFEGSNVTTIGVMDPLGADIEIGKGHYAAVLTALMGSLEHCQH